MKSLSLLLLISFLSFSFVEEYNALKKPPSIILKATKDFTPITKQPFVPSYLDKRNKAMAINAGKHKNKFGKVFHKYKGKSGTFNLKFTSLTETDGESKYRILIDDELITEFQNPKTRKDYAPHEHVIKNIFLKKGKKIYIEFSSHSNNKIPEGNAFAFSRGRWTSLELISSQE